MSNHESNELTDVLIYGAGMLGQQVAHLLETHFLDEYRLVGFVDDEKPQRTVVIDRQKTVGALSDVACGEKYDPRSVKLVFGIGYSNMRARRAAFEQAIALGYECVGLVHPDANVDPSATLGVGVIVLAGAVVDQYVKVGDASYLHIGSRFGENCDIGVNNYFSAGSTLGGSVSVGRDNFFGINSTVTNDIAIGNNNFLNAGSLIYKRVGDDIRIVEFREQREVRNS